MDVNSFTQLVGAVPSGGYITETSAKPSDQQHPVSHPTLAENPTGCKAPVPGAPKQRGRPRTVMGGGHEKYEWGEGR